jgi:hypothetical protein
LVLRKNQWQQPVKIKRISSSIADIGAGNSPSEKLANSQQSANVCPVGQAAGGGF